MAQSSKKRGRKQTSSRNTPKLPGLVVTALLILACAAAAYYLLHRTNSTGDNALHSVAPPEIPNEATTTVAVTPPEQSTPDSNPEEQTVPNGSEAHNRPTLPPASTDQNSSDGSSQVSGETTRFFRGTESPQPISQQYLARQTTISRASGYETSPDGSPAGVVDESVNDLVAKLDSFYAMLDSRPYMADFNLQEPSRSHFSKLIQKLLQNPPEVARETDNLFTLLKNTAHFFRILGRNNVMLLKGILDREHDSLESILDILFRLSDHPDIVKREYDIDLSEDALVDYCGFFLSTMGGRLYLFRRDSTSRMAVTFYAIKVLDRSIQRGSNRLGIDLLKPVKSLIEEIENGGKNLKNRDKYLETLYILEERYASGAI